MRVYIAHTTISICCIHTYIFICRVFIGSYNYFLIVKFAWAACSAISLFITLRTFRNYWAHLKSVLLEMSHFPIVIKLFPTTKNENARKRHRIIWLLLCKCSLNMQCTERTHICTYIWSYMYRQTYVYVCMYTFRLYTRMWIFRFK